jgi:two-component system NtrC family sensor kinase
MNDNVISFPASGHGQNIVLLVDDEFMMRGVLAEILQDCGFQVVTAQSGEEAIGLLSKRNDFDLVFSDIKMPGIDGFELAKWVHENRAGTPVILASGYSGKTNMAADLCGAEFLKKPYDFDHIIEKIRETIARKKPRSA